MSTGPGVVIGPDGRPRCAWSDSTEDYRAYHDREWGRAVHGDVALFERITLESFQSGLSWLTILRKREGFRSAFRSFDPLVVAAFDAQDVERLMGDAAIVRNRRKIDAAIGNARALVRLQDAQGDAALDELLWSFAPRGPRRRPASLAELQPCTAASSALSAALKAHGFVFVGPTTMHAAMQACGLVDDHVRGCHLA